MSAPEVRGVISPPINRAAAFIPSAESVNLSEAGEPAEFYTNRAPITSATRRRGLRGYFITSAEFYQCELFRATR